MKYKKLLSVIPFFGGKGRMAHFIADKLDYSTTDVFVTPFGGGCRVLLNKPRHLVEIYNDFSPGLCALMRVLSNMDTAIELIRRVMDSEYSEEEFVKAKKMFDDCERKVEEETAFEQMVTAFTEEYLQHLASPYHLSNSEKEALKKSLRQDVQKAMKEVLYKGDDGEKKSRKSVYDDIKYEIRCLVYGWHEYFVEESICQMEDFRNEFENLFSIWQNATAWGKDIYQIDDMDAAFATYIVYMMSRDAMGTAYTNAKFRGTEHYHKRAESLFECAKRLEGIQVQQLDAFSFFRKGGDFQALRKSTGGAYETIGDWLNNPSVMMYLDPSYISVESEREALRGIDWISASSLSDAIKAKNQEEKRNRGKRNTGKTPQNLGSVYSRFFDYKDHERFLRVICQAKCKILISNYDLILYHKYLTMNGWSRAEYLTSTSVGSKAGNSRTEVIWWNY